MKLRYALQKPEGIGRHRNSIAFGSAPRREAVSQLDRPAVSQTETHTLGFLSVADTGPSSGEDNWSQNWQRPNGNAGGRRHFGRRFEPRCGQHGSGTAAGVHPPGFEPPTEKSAAGCVTIRPGVDVTQMCLPLLGAFSAKTFDPPPPPHTPPHTPLKKVLSSFRGCRPRNQKVHWGMVLLGKIMISQGVGHQISCLGVCYANDPPKRGVYNARACA